LSDDWLQEVMIMEKERIETIRVVADRIAGEILGQNDKKLLQSLWWSSRYDQLRALLIRAGVRRAERGQQPLIGFDEFVTVFEHEEDVERPDWRLARDLVLIRIIEQLHQKGWFQQHPDALPKEATQLPILDESDLRSKEEFMG
jgi:CRISPR-associated protein Cst1